MCAGGEKYLLNAYTLEGQVLGVGLGLVLVFCFIFQSVANTSTFFRYINSTARLLL